MTVPTLVEESHFFDDLKKYVATTVNLLRFLAFIAKRKENQSPFSHVFFSLEKTKVLEQTSSAHINSHHSGKFKAGVVFCRL